MSGPSGLRFGFRRGGFLFRIVFFFVILGSFLGGTALRDHLFRPKGAGGPPGRPRDRFFDDFWRISGSVLGVRGGRFPDFPATFFRWFLGTAPGTLCGGFWVDFGRFFGAIWVPFWRIPDFVIL